MAVLTPVVNDELIDRVLRRAKRDLCAPGDARCCRFSYGDRHALSTLTPAGLNSHSRAHWR